MIEEKEKTKKELQREIYVLTIALRERTISEEIYRLKFHLLEKQHELLESENEKLIKKQAETNAQRAEYELRLSSTRQDKYAIQEELENLKTSQNK